MNDRLFLLNFFAWLVALIAILGSLFFSEVMEFPPCALCWYQRIAMYPLVFLLGISSFRKEYKEIVPYALSLAITGWVIALYHNLLHYEIVPETMASCREGVSCSTVYIEWMGFITIPILSFMAFTLIIGLLFYMHRITKNEK